jgi:hypothetical protein
MHYKGEIRMTREEAINRLSNLENQTDEDGIKIGNNMEDTHIEADAILLELLESLGEIEVVSAYQKASEKYNFKYA